jgi:hypothetical protein
VNILEEWRTGKLEIYQPSSLPILQRFQTESQSINNLLLAQPKFSLLQGQAVFADAPKRAAVFINQFRQPVRSALIDFDFQHALLRRQKILIVRVSLR